jgi:hypothetical protein
MADTNWKEEVGRRVKYVQIIVASLLAGCLTFMGIAIVLVQRKVAGEFQDLPDVIIWLPVGFAVVACFVQFIVTKQTTAHARQAIAEGTWRYPGGGDTSMADYFAQTGDAGRLFVVFQMRTIVAAAILEGAAFFSLVIFLVGGNGIPLVTAMFLVGRLLLLLPTRRRVFHWIEDQLLHVERQR